MYAEPERMQFFKLQIMFFGSSWRSQENVNAITSLIQDMTERHSFAVMCKQKIEQLRSQLSLKDDYIQALQRDLARKNVKNELPEIAIQLATVIEKHGEKAESSAFSDLLVNSVKDTKRWNDDTKSFFAIILDYGGPALLKIIKEKIDTSLQTSYIAARSKFHIPAKLEECIFGRAAAFYERIGYHGPFVLAIDATAVLPCIKVKGNRLTGIATEEDIIVKTAQDIIKITTDESTEKARLANAFVLTPLKDHVPSFVLAVSAAVKGQNHETVGDWFVTH